jgi:predicted branched-subunit amino acid permease
MNISIFAGSAQFVMVNLWLPPLPILEIIMAVMIVNLRYVFIGASLQPLFRDRSMGHKACVMHLVADENWAVTMAAWRQGKGSSIFLLGGGVCVFLFWCLGTLTGFWAGAAVSHPETWALDFAFPAIFGALAASLWRGRADIIPWLAAIVLAIWSSQWIPGNWYIVIGGVGGALFAGFPFSSET